MAEKTISLGSLQNVILYDDVDFPNGLFSDGAIQTSKVPSSANDVLRQVDSGAGGSVAPSNAQYVVIALDGVLSQERVLAVGDNLTKTDGGANGNVTLDTAQGIKTTNSPQFVNVNLTGDLRVGGTKVVGSQGSAIASLTDSTGGTANDTVQALTNPADLPATADALRDDLVANLIPELRNNYADLAAKVNTILTALRNHGLIAT